MEFVHLHVHTEYSLLDGACRIKDLVAKAKDLSMKSLAITDHGVMYGVVDFYEECKKQGIKPIIGCEVYLTEESRFVKSGTGTGYSSPYHLILLASNNTGYKNLIKIVSKAFTEGFFYKPRVDFELLNEYSEGIICLSACLSGLISRKLLQEDYSGAKESAIKLLNIFGKDNFYLEIQSNGIDEQRIANKGLIKLSDETGIPLVATNDVHYIKKNDSYIQDVLMCIQTGRKINDEDRMRFATDEFFLKSKEEMEETFKSVPSSVSNTVLIADKCNVELEFGRPVLPDFGIPSGYTADTYLKKVCFEGAAHRYPDGIPEPALERLNYELSVISQMGYSEYYLIVWDFIKYAKDNGIMVGPGRGSGAGSLVAYCMNITNIDSLKYNLAFERFLNPERISMPDFDVDFSDVRRKEVIDYVIRKYGEDRVAQIITFGTMAAKGAIRDVGRVLDVPYIKTDELAKMVPFNLSVSEALSSVPELKEKYDSDYLTKKILDTSIKLEGIPRNCSTHAAGVVLTRNPVTDYVPVHKNGDSVATQFPMSVLEKIGLLKVDFLGLRTLTVIQDTVRQIYSNYGKTVDFDSMEMNDPAVFKTISSGKTSGIFQLESRGMSRFMSELQPDSLEDIIAGIALYRPGPMDQIPVYIKNKKNPSGINYDHILLKPILDVTYGCMVYQEQVMQIVRDLAGYTMGQSDLVRRAMAKKKHDVMAKERINFVKGALSRGIDEQISNKIFDKMTDFASYAFNKAHATSYAVVAYITAWLKTYYPAEFMAELMNSNLSYPEKIAGYYAECKTMGIEIKPPCINSSEECFTVRDGSILFGLGALKNIGVKCISEITQVRKNKGTYKSFTDFCEKNADTDINRRVIENLIKSGAFSSLGYTRHTLLEGYENVFNTVFSSRPRYGSGMMSLFDIVEEDRKSTENIEKLEEYSSDELLSMEKQVIGFYVSSNPLEKYSIQLDKICTLRGSDLIYDDSSEKSIPVNDGEKVIVAGIVTNIKRKNTKNNTTMAFVTLEDISGSFELIFFPKTYEKYTYCLKEETIAVVTGRVSLRDEEGPKIIPDDIVPIDSYLLKNDTRRASEAEIPVIYVSASGIKALKTFLKYISDIPGERKKIFINDRDNPTHKIGEASIPLLPKIREELDYICKL